MTTTNAGAALESAVGELPAGLRDHVLRVVVEARRLARIHGVDEERAVLAALGHDLARGEGPAELLELAAKAGIEPSPIDRAEPILLHGGVGAWLMAERYGIADEDVLAAARYHTTARVGMGAIERLLYVADKIEPQKAQSDAALADARLLADGSLTDAMRRLLDRQVARAIERGWPLHPNTVAARNELLVTRE